MTLFMLLPCGQAGCDVTALPAHRYFFTFSTSTRVHDANTGEVVRVLRGHAGLVKSVVPSATHPFQLYTLCADGNVHAHHAAAGVHVASRALDAVVVVVVDRHRHNNLLRLLVHKVCRAGPHLIPTSRVRCCRCSCCW